MTYHIRHRHNGIDIIDPEDNSATYIRYQDIPELVDQLNEAHNEHRCKQGIVPDVVIDRLLR